MKGRRVGGREEGEEQREEGGDESRRVGMKGGGCDGREEGGDEGEG